jgi:hypothetical protein
MFEQTAHPPRDQPAAEGKQGDDAPAGARSMLYRIVLGAATTLVSINIWTGGPLLALWVGSRVQASIGTLSMAAVGATIGVLIVITFVLYRMLAWLNVRYNAAIGRKMPRHQLAWHKPMSAERRKVEAARRPPNGVERIVMVSVIVAAEALIVWFFFFAHYSFAS